jgi:hypothetical protein
VPWRRTWQLHSRRSLASCSAGGDRQGRRWVCWGFMSSRTLAKVTGWPSGGWPAISQRLGPARRRACFHHPGRRQSGPCVRSEPMETIRRPVRRLAGPAASQGRPGRPVPWWAIVSAALPPVLLTGGWLVAGALQRASYNPVRQTVSVLAGHAGTDRWVMTGALLQVGGCHLVTAAGLAGVGTCAGSCWPSRSCSPSATNRPVHGPRGVQPMKPHWERPSASTGDLLDITKALLARSDDPISALSLVRQRLPADLAPPNAPQGRMLTGSAFEFCV